MARFVFESMDRTGAQSGGTIEAESLSAAAHTIRARGHVVLSIVEQKKSKATRGGPRFFIRSVRQRDVAEFCRRLSTLLKAGVGVAEGLETIGEAQAKGRFRTIILRMSDRIRSGYSLSETVDEHPEAFPPVAGGMIAAAEASGELPAILIRLATHIEKRLEIRESVLMAMLYPSIVIALTSCVLVLMLAWVFPKLSVFLQSQNKELPVMAMALLDVADFASSKGATIAAVLLGLLLLLMLFSKTKKGRLFIHRILLKLPILGIVFRAASTQVWTRTLSDLLRSGLSLQQGLKITADVVPNQEYRLVLNRVCRKIVAGESFGEALGNTSPLFDNLVCKLVMVGESSGTLEEGLEELARFAEGDLNRRVTVLARLFEPAVIVVVGIVVGLVFITCFQTIYAYLPS